MDHVINRPRCRKPRWIKIYKTYHAPVSSFLYVILQHLRLILIKKLSHTESEMKNALYTKEKRVFNQNIVLPPKKISVWLWRYLS